MGLEGFAARAYYYMFTRLFGAEWGFTRRTRRPPADPVNAVLSFGYTLVSSELSALVESHGLDPGIGFYHTLEYGRPSLAVDLVEEFRAPLVDRFALYLTRRKILSPADFETVEGKGCRFRQEALKRFFIEYEKWMTGNPGFKEDVSRRSLLWRQTERAVKFVENGEPYRPLDMGERDADGGDL